VSSNFTTALIFPAGQVPLSSVWPSSGIRYPEGTAEGNHYLSMATWTFFFGTKKMDACTGNLTSCLLLRCDPLGRRH